MGMTDRVVLRFTMLRTILSILCCAGLVAAAAEVGEKSFNWRPLMYSLTGISSAVAITFLFPPLVVKIRFWLFTKINGDKGIEFPNEKVNGRYFKQVYASKSCDLRNNCGLSDFFWYHLSPGPDVHQEQVETSPTYEMLSNATKKLLSPSNERIAALMRKYAVKHMESVKGTWTVSRLKDFWFPMFARFYYELIFNEEAPDELVPLLTSSGRDVLASLKCVKLRDMPLRFRLTRFLEDKLRSGEKCKDIFDDKISLEWRALHLQGIFFHTGCVQMSEAMAHTMIAIGQHPHVEQKLRNDKNGQYLELVLNESLRLFPLFGIANRITSGDIEIDDGTVYPAGTVMLFNYPKYQTEGYTNANEFIPERWEQLSKSEANYIPFGVVGNRPCPGQRLALVAMREITKVAVEYSCFYSPIVHSRSMPDGGLALVVSREHNNGQKKPALLSALVAYERLCVVFRSACQLVFGAYMVWHASKLRLATQLYDEGRELHEYSKLPRRPAVKIARRAD